MFLGTHKLDDEHHNGQLRHYKGEDTNRLQDGAEVQGIGDLGGLKIDDVTTEAMRDGSTGESH